MKAVVFAVFVGLFAAVSAEISFAEAAKNGPFGYADYLDLDKLKYYTDELKEDDRRIAMMKAQFKAEGKSTDFPQLSAMRNSDMAAPVRSALVRGDVLTQWSLFGSDDTKGKVAVRSKHNVQSNDNDMAEIKKEINKAVKDAVKNELSGAIASAISAIEEQTKMKREQIAKQWSPRSPDAISMLAEDGDNPKCQKITDMDECEEAGFCDWVLNDGCHRRKCSTYEEFDECADENTGCRWVTNSADHDKDHCTDMTPDENTMLVQQTAKIIATNKKNNVNSEKYDTQKALLKATSELMKTAQDADDGIMPKP